VDVIYFEPNGDLVPDPGPKSDLIKTLDFDVGKDNLVEAKHHRLARCQGRTIELKPNTEVRKRLENILDYPSTKFLTSEEQDLVWRYRHFLTNFKSGLIKFVKCVNWNAKQEIPHALDLIKNKWTPMEPEDALVLLGPDFR